MSDKDKYLREFDKITGQLKGQVLRREYTIAKREAYPKLVEKYNQYIDLSEVDAKKKEEEIRAYAKVLLRGENGFMSARRGAELYEKIGKGKKAIPKLLEAARRDKNGAIQSYRTIRAFIERNSGERKPLENGLEGKTMVFAVSTLAGIALSVFSFKATGNAIGNLTGTSQGLLGVFLFIFGLAGMFFSIRK